MPQTLVLFKNQLYIFFQLYIKKKKMYERGKHFIPISQSLHSNEDNNFHEM